MFFFLIPIGFVPSEINFLITTTIQCLQDVQQTLLSAVKLTKEGQPLSNLPHVGNAISLENEVNKRTALTLANLKKNVELQIQKDRERFRKHEEQVREVMDR